MESITKILFLSHKLNIGGAEQRLFDFLKYESTNKRISCKIYCLERNGDIGDEINTMGFPVIVAKGNNALYKCFQLLKYIRTEKPDIIHIHLWPARLYTVFIKIFCRTKIIYTIENQLKGWTRDLIFLEKLFCLFTAKIVAVSESVKQSYCKKINVAESQIAMIHNGVNVSCFDAPTNNCFRKELGLSDKEIIITVVSRLTETKGHIYLIRAAKLLTTKYPYLKFVIVGDGDYKKVILEEINRYGLANFFALTGFRRDINNILSSTNIFVLPSYYEGQGIVILEAMSAQKAVVATNIDGVNEVVRNDNSIIVPPCDHQSLSMAIEELIIDKNKRDILGIKAREYVASNFSIESMCKAYEDLYDNVSKRKNKTKNILYVEKGAGFGGSSNSLITIVDSLNRSIFNPIVAIKNYGPHIRKINNLRILKLNDFNETTKPSYVNFLLHILVNIIPESIKLYFIIKWYKISLVHINNNILLGISGIIAAKLSAVPCVCHIRETRELTRSERLFAKYVDKFIILNTDTIEMHKNFISQEKMVVIYNGVKINKTNEENTKSFRDEFDLDCVQTVGVVGRIVEGKGQKEFILAAEKILKLRPDTKFIVVGEAKGGDKEYCEEIKTFVCKNNLENNVVFVGWRDDIGNVLNGLDLLVHPTTTFREGLPRILIEAMALAKPIVATDIAGSRDCVVNNETGFLVEPGNINKMEEKIIYLLENPSIAKKMGEAGRKRAEELFDIKKTIKNIEDVYNNILVE